MLFFKKRTILGNLSCQKQLIDFRNNVVEYFNNCSSDEWNTECYENEKAENLRAILNQNLLNVQEIIHGADVATHLIYTPPPMIGGYRQNIDVITNIFHLDQYRIKPKHLLDFIDRAIGVYKNDQEKSLIRTFNPFFWIGIALDFIVSAPFILLGKVGLNARKIEESNLGKISKFFLYFISLIAGIVSIAQAFGWLDKLKTILEV